MSNEKTEKLKFHLEFNSLETFESFLVLVAQNQQESDKQNTSLLRNATNKLKRALNLANKAIGSPDASPTRRLINGEYEMANQVLDELAPQIMATVGVMESATVFVNGVANKIAEAVKKAVENGATEEQLAPFNELGDALQTQASQLATAVEANSGNDSGGGDVGGGSGNPFPVDPTEPEEENPPTGADETGLRGSGKF